MKPIETIALIGLGAVGTNFAYYFHQHSMKGTLRIVADQKRVERYQNTGVYYNHERCDFDYAAAETIMEPVDLAIICTKASGLEAACVALKGHTDHNTLFMSAVNGITSEEIMADYFPKQNIIYTVAQGMDATKDDNQVICHNIGELCFGAVSEEQKEAVELIHEFFLTIGFPHHVKTDIIHHQWGKFMLNCGLNQVVALSSGTYASIQHEGKMRSQMLAAMKEVQQLSLYEGICLQEAEIAEWAAMCDTLSPSGMPSMAQDVKAKRKTEVSLFAEEVCKRSAKYHLPCPVNTRLFEQLTALENAYIV